MSWAPAARTAAAVVKQGQQQRTAEQGHGQEPLRKRQLLQQEQKLAQAQQPHTQQGRTRRHQRSMVSRTSGRGSSFQTQENSGPRRRRPPRAGTTRSARYANGEESLRPKNGPSTTKSCNSGNNGGGDAGKRGTQPGSAIVASQMFKTKLCIDHQTRGCTRGDKCPYAHSVEEMRNLPDLRKTKMCCLVLAGKGCKNRACKFAHSEEELRYTCTFSEFKTRLCRFAQERGGRGCLYGVRCPYAHSPSELRQLESPKGPPANGLKLGDNGTGAEQEDGVTPGQRPQQSGPSPSGVQDLKGRHGLWGEQRELQPSGAAVQQRNDNQRRRKEQPRSQYRRWQKAQQNKSPQHPLRAPNQCQPQQEVHQQKKQSRPQLRPLSKQQQFKANHASAGWENVTSASQMPQEAEAGQGDAPDEGEAKALSCLGDGCRKPLTSEPLQSGRQKTSDPLLSCTDSPEKAERLAVAKLPRPLSTGTRATSVAVIDAAGTGSVDISQKKFHSTSHLPENQRRDVPKHASEPQLLQYEEEDSCFHSVGVTPRTQQHYWEQQTVGNTPETHAPPQLLPFQRTLLPVDEPPQRYISVSNSPPTAVPPTLAVDRTALGKARSAMRAKHAPESCDDDETDIPSGPPWNSEFGFAALPVSLASRITAGTLLNESDHDNWLEHGSSKRRNGVVAVVPPPGFEHVRIKPLSEFAYTAPTPWLHASSATDSTDSEECLLLHLHRQLLLHCQRQSDSHLPADATLPRAPSNSNGSACIHLSPAESYLDEVSKSIWEDRFLTAPRSADC